MYVRICLKFLFKPVGPIHSDSRCECGGRKNTGSTKNKHDAVESRWGRRMPSNTTHDKQRVHRQSGKCSRRGSCGRCDRCGRRGRGKCGAGAVDAEGVASMPDAQVRQVWQVQHVGQVQQGWQPGASYGCRRPAIWHHIAAGKQPYGIIWLLGTNHMASLVGMGAECSSCSSTTHGELCWKRWCNTGQLAHAVRRSLVDIGAECSSPITTMHE